MAWPDPGSLPVWALVIGGLIAGAAVWYGGTKLAVLGDRIAERTGWSQAFVGLLLLAAMTEVPELVTTIGAAAADDPAMAVNNLFGGVTLQTLILVVADLSLTRGPLTFFVPSTELILEGLMLVLLLALTLAFVAIGERVSFLGVGLFAVLLLGIYVGALWLLRRHEGDRSWRPVNVPEAPEEREASEERPSSLGALWLGIAGAGLLVFAGGVSIVFFADAFAARTGLGSSFVGATLVAGTTSLPELSTTLGAVRLGAYSMAVANIFGSNAIMVALITPADIAYRGGPLLDAVDDPARLSAIAGIAVTAIYLVGLVERRDRAFLRLGVDSWAVLVVSTSSLIALYVSSR